MSPSRGDCRRQSRCLVDWHPDARGNRLEDLEAPLVASFRPLKFFETLMDVGNPTVGFCDLAVMAT
ncbi:MAG: hypothetical protein AAGD07_16625 [Planctomycetota bacterium]